MRNILKHKADHIIAHLLPQQQILNLFQFRVGKMVPTVGIAIKHCGRLDKLAPIAATLTFESVVSITNRGILKREKLPQIVD